MKKCSFCDGGSLLHGCNICSGTGRLPDGAPELEDGWAYYCPDCGLFKAFRDGVCGEALVHFHGAPMRTSNRALAWCRGIGECVEQGLRAIAEMPAPKPTAKLTVTAIEPNAGVITVEPPPPRDANGREIKVGDVLRWAPGFYVRATGYRATGYRATVIALHQNAGGNRMDGAVRTRRNDETIGYLSDTSVTVIATPAPQPADAPEQAGCGWSREFRDAKFVMRCVGGRAIGNFAGTDFGPCPNCAAKTSASGSAAGDVPSDSAEAPGTAPEKPRPAAEPEPITCDECGVKILAGIYDGGYHRCIYCDHRTSHAVSMVENGCGITAAPPPVADEDGECWANPSAEWP